MKRSILVCAAAFAAGLAFADPVDGLAATVGSASILRSEVESEFSRYGEKAGLGYDEVLNKMIDRKLILKAAKDAKMTMQDWVVDNRIREIVENSFGGDRNRLIDSLSRDRLSYSEFRQRIMDDLIVGAMRWNVVEKNVAASPAAMRKEFEENRDSYRTADTVTVSVIFLKPEDASYRATIDEALKTESFAEVAKSYSAGGNAETGGLYKDIRPEAEFNSEVCAVIAKTPVGALSGWTDVGGWSLLVKKDGESAARAKTFAEAYSDVEQAVRDKEAKRLYDRWLNRLKAETYIRVY